MTGQAPIVLFGGTFDPPTRAHAELPPQAAALAEARKLLYIPAAISPHKMDDPPASGVHRRSMVELVVDGIEGAELCDIELDRDGPSYSIDTIRELREITDSDIPFRLLIGDDQAVNFHEWKDWKSIIELAEPIVLPRLWSNPDEFAHALVEEGCPWSKEQVEQWLTWRVDLPCMDISSDEVRAIIAGGGDPQDELQPDVYEYIEQQGLYQ